MAVVELKILVHVPDGLDIDSVALERNGTPLGFRKDAEPFMLRNGSWEVQRNSKYYLHVHNPKETLTKVKS